MGVTKHDSFTAEQNRIAALFKALGHPARIAIMQKLLGTDCCICRDFTDEIDLAQPTISRHLKELKAAGLIAGTVEGTSLSYCANRDCLEAIRQTLGGLLGRNILDPACQQ